MRRGIPIVAALFFWCSELEAAPRVVVVSPPEHQHTASRLRDELVVMGVEVELLGELPPADVREPPSAVVVVSGPPMRMALRFAAAAAGIAEETVISALSDGSDSEAGLVLRAAEMLRARLVPPALPPTLPPTEVPPPALPAPPAPTPPATPPPPRRARPLSFHAAPAVLLSPGGVPPMAQLRLGVGYRVGWRLSLALDAMSPTAPGVVGDEGGTIDLWMFHLGVAASISFTDLESPLAVFGGLGLGTTAVFYSGEATPPNTAAEGSAWTIAPTANLGAAYYPLDVLGVRTDAHLSVVRPEPVFRVAGEEVARFGQPALVLSLGLEVRP